MDSLFIGNVKIERSAALAPMASVADRAYRLTAKRFGASYVVGEMASCKGLCYNDSKTERLLSVTDAERPMAIQLFGAEPRFMADAVKIAEKFAPDIIDINAGCPMPKIVCGGAGSALMKTPKLFADMIEAAAGSTNIPVTVKIRAGWSNDSINAAEIAKIAEQSGAAAVTIHARTREQLYSGKADMDMIREVKRAVSVPVIGNGDVSTPGECKQMYEYTGCDLVMIGRGSYGRPWLFGQIREFLDSGKFSPDPPLTEKLEIMREHIALLCEDKGERVGMKEARRHASWYLKGIQGAARFRNLCGRLSTLAELDELIQMILTQHRMTERQSLCGADIDENKF